MPSERMGEMVFADMCLLGQPFQRNRLGEMLVDKLLDFAAIQHVRYKGVIGDFHLRAAACLGKENIQDAQADAQIALALAGKLPEDILKIRGELVGIVSCLEQAVFWQRAGLGIRKEADAAYANDDIGKPVLRVGALRVFHTGVD